MNIAASIVVLSVIWAAASGGLTLPNLLLGVVVAAAALLLIRDRLKSRGGLGRLLRFASLALLFLSELVLSAITVAVWTLRPNVRAGLAPAIIAFPLTVTRDIEITLLANLITLTPGTLSVDVSADHKRLYVHALDCRDPEGLKRQIADGFERKIIEAFR